MRESVCVRGELRDDLNEVRGKQLQASRVRKLFLNSLWTQLTVALDIRIRHQSELSFIPYP